MPKITGIFGSKLREIRKRFGIDVNAMARDLEIQAQTLTLWELGRKYPSYNNIVKVLNYFNDHFPELGINANIFFGSSYEPEDINDFQTIPFDIMFQILISNL